MIEDLRRAAEAFNKCLYSLEEMKKDELLTHHSHCKPLWQKAFLLGPLAKTTQTESEFLSENIFEIEGAMSISFASD
jgi:hypothetical protein